MAKLVVAGVDEAGRGALAGPVVVAAVILDDDQPISGLKDSKKLSAAKREELYQVILNKAVCVAAEMVSAEKIDEINILQATLLAMRTAVGRLSVTPDLVLIDGNQDPKVPRLESRCIVRGDTSEAAISAASIVAKVTRDLVMRSYDSRYPGYGFAKHKGYGTAEHLAALRSLGPSLIHRHSFAPVRDWYLVGVQPNIAKP